MNFTPAHMNSVLVEMWHSFQQKSACVIIDDFKKTKLLPLDPPDHETNTQTCLAATQTPSGKKSEEVEEIARASMAYVAVDVIKTIDPMVILRSRGNPSSNLLIRGAAYDTVQQRTIPPIQEIKADEMEMRKRRMVRMPNMDREEEGRRMNADSSAGIYVTASVEAQCRMIAENRKIKEEEKIKNSKVNALKRAAHMNLRATLFAKLVANLPNDRMVSDDPSTPLLQVLLSLSTEIIKDSYKHLGGKMGEFPDLNKRTVAEAIVRKWGERC